ncbi:uncharacterized protein SPSK_10768 [Sporothrix schenckii 1099-18]|uniref:Uncharacterized protein n=2 Tax=Sporothrix schenckii TaxID=29908 RepID=U7Q1S1_SPOS1|nr:uncharacterized protein SPSK_10768 [Sporothrix schenckii 1099-18]ERT01132.1 hypothetical protein HMPREF1624_02372 [Sporothrix schenckii ATCC 58251]KJR88266.1 hypothetical protein SPSK_10768 [Sporothrix schenckii 1099-18]
MVARKTPAAGASAGAAAAAAAVDVIPTAWTDQIPPLQGIRTRTFFVVKARLDADAMKRGLDTLIREHWRKLGGRLVLNKSTSLQEYHVPKTFPPAETYDLFQWSTETKTGPIDADAPQLMQTPPLESSEGGGGIAFLPAVTDYDPKFRPASWPYDVDHGTNDTPILLVHLTQYEDATVVALSVPHAVADQLGTSLLVRAWMGVIAGQAPPPLMEQDPLPQGRAFSSLTKAEQRPQKGKMHVYYTGEYPIVLLGFFPDLIFNAEETKRIMFLPMATVKALRARITKALNASGGDPGITDNDVITAVMTKLSRIHKGPVTLNLSQTVNIRGRLPQLTGPAMDGWLHNGLTHASTRFRLDRNTPLAQIAKDNHSCVAEMRDPVHVDIHLAIIREMARRKQNMHICEPFETSFSVTSWPAAWRDLDFSAAVATAATTSAEDSGATTPLPPPDVFVIGRSGLLTTPHRFHATVMFRSDAGYWIDIGFSTKNFVAMKAYLAQDPKLEKL